MHMGDQRFDGVARLRGLSSRCKPFCECFPGVNVSEIAAIAGAKNMGLANGSQEETWLEVSWA